MPDEQSDGIVVVRESDGSLSLVGTTSLSTELGLNPLSDDDGDTVTEPDVEGADGEA